MLGAIDNLNGLLTIHYLNANGDYLSKLGAIDNLNGLLTIKQRRKEDAI